MDHLDEAKAHVVKAMMALENALTEALPAQAPNSNVKQVRLGILRMKQIMREATKHLSDAETALKRLSNDGGQFLKPDITRPISKQHLRPHP